MFGSSPLAASSKLCANWPLATVEKVFLLSGCGSVHNLLLSRYIVLCYTMNIAPAIAELLLI